MAESGKFQLKTEALGALPLVNHFLERLALERLLARYLPYSDFRILLPSAKAVGLVVRNLVIYHEPLYALEEWARRFPAELLGLAACHLDLINDDRVGRSLLNLFLADRASMLTELVLGAVREFDIDVSQFHNDSTSITFSGSYRGEGSRLGKPVASITFGYNKDHRPDLRQLIWILTISADGAVPIAFRVADGNTHDDRTHIETWEGLLALAGRPDFLYVADCKLANRENLDHIVTRGGRFVCVLPRTRSEDRWFRQWQCDHVPSWQEVCRQPSRRSGEPDDVWSACPSPIPSAEGYRIVWVRSSAMLKRDTEVRQARIERGIAAIEALAAKLAGPRPRQRTRASVDAAATSALIQAGAERWVDYRVTEAVEATFRQERRGSPAQETRYRRLTRMRFQLSWVVRQDVVVADAASDGCFPLITNDLAMTEAEVLAAYRYQPRLEKRHALLKSGLLVTPMFLKDPARVEGLLCCYFIALLVHALIERELRRAMAATNTEELALYPEDRTCRAPTASRVLEMFAHVSRYRLFQDGQLVQTFAPELTPLQLKILDLLGIPVATYRGEADALAV